MRVGIQLTLSARAGDKTFQSTIGWNAAAEKDEKPAMPPNKEGEEEDLTSIPVGFRHPNEA